MVDLPGPALLFCPADRPERYAKAAARADGVILDLEDGVGPAEKAAAREHLTSIPLDPARTIVRLNAATSADFALDVAALARTKYRLVMLAKAERPDQLHALAGFQVVALCETPRGVLAAPAMAACAQTVALMWGAEDLVAALGGWSSRDSEGRYRDVARTARTQVLLAAGAASKAAIDAVHVDIADLEGLRAEVEDAAACGFVATACIHPSQVATIRAGYRPSADELAWAHLVLAAAQTAAGAFRLHGRMVDEPVLRQAARTVARAADADLP